MRTILAGQLPSAGVASTRGTVYGSEGALMVLPIAGTRHLSLDPPTPFRVYRCLSRSAP